MSEELRYRGETITYTNDGLVAKDADDAVRLIRTEGIAIMPGVLTPAECDDFDAGMWATAAHLTSGRLVPEDPTTYHHLWDLYPNHGMLIQHWGWAHTQAIWDVRQNCRVSEVYSALYGVPAEDLLVSFDGCSFGLGPVMRGKTRGMYRGTRWLHTDQRPSDSTFQCVQSWVTAKPVRPGDATLRFLSGSARLHGQFAAEFGLQGVKDDWYKLSDAEYEWFVDPAQGCRDLRIRCNAGDQVLWDSRLIHSGCEALPAECLPDPAAERNHRSVAYVCFQPRRDAGAGLEKLLAKRRKIFDPTDPWFLRTTSHWPLKCKMFGKHPRTYGKELVEVPPRPAPALTLLGQKLAGMV